MLPRFGMLAGPPAEAAPPELMTMPMPGEKGSHMSPDCGSFGGTKSPDGRSKRLGVRRLFVEEEALAPP